MCADTDGDGIDDGDEDKNHNGIFEPDNEDKDLKETNPRWQDTDNDSLSDGLEIGGWNISVYFEATGEKRSGYPIVVDSNPWINDTDDDGLTDGQEFENATHPRSDDTDGDGMTDLYELTGPAPSDPCGIEGTPPNLSGLEITNEEEWEWMWVGQGPLVAYLYVRTRNEIQVTVTATDNVGLDWIGFHIDGKGKETVYFDQGTTNSTATAFFDHDLLGQWVSGYDLNITVSDVNGNEGYLEFHIDSAFEAFVQWLIGQVTALAKFVMERASAAIAWIWRSIETMAQGVINPIISSSNTYTQGLLLSMFSIEFDSQGNPTEETVTSHSTAFFSPFYLTVFTIILIILISMSIINYFLPWISWLLLGIVILIIGIISLSCFNSRFTEDDYEEDKNSFDGISFDYSYLFSSPS